MSRFYRGREEYKSAPTTSVKHRRKPITEVEELEEVMRGSLTASDLSDDQKKAYRFIHDWFDRCTGHELLSLGGYAGTGKSTLVSVLAIDFERSGKHIAFCAFTGKAAGVLRKKLRTAGIDAGPIGMTPHFCGTIHSLCYIPFVDKQTGAVLSWDRRDSLDEYDLIVIDEASMVDDEMLREIREYGIPILAVGDHGQLPPVKSTGGLMLDPDLRLEKIHRQAEGNPIISLSAYIRDQGDLPRTFQDCEEVEFIRAEQFEGKLREAYAAYGGPSEVGILAYTNRMRLQLNQLGHHVWLQSNPLNKPPPSSQVICLRNMKGLIFNGMRGWVDGDLKDGDYWWEGKFFFPDDELEVSGGALKAQFNQERTFADFETIDKACGGGDNFSFQAKWGSVGMLLDYGYALTVHKSQGSAFKHVFLVYERPSRVTPEEFKRWLYTAVTRASQKITIVEG